MPSPAAQRLCAALVLTAFIPPATAVADSLMCASAQGAREHCAAETSAGVVLMKSTGTTACLLGKTWGYDDTGVWVFDGCVGEFIVGQTTGQQDTKTPEHIPNLGFLLYNGEKGQIYFRLFTYARYLNQKSLDASYVDSFGVLRPVQRRQDIQLQKFFSPFSGWFLTPKFRYYLYVWSSNPSQGDPAQVVGAGNISYTFNRSVTFGIGITSLPTVRSTEGQFPYWLSVDARLTSDEFFRGSYTDGFWFKGDLGEKVKYQAMFANNLSILGVNAQQLDNKFDTQSFMVSWFPTTGEFGYFGTFGDYDDHQTVATRIGLHYSHSLETKQSQPGTNAIENTQIRLSDGNIIFNPDLFGPGIAVDDVDWHLVSVDGGIKHRGRSLEGEAYWRHLTNFKGINTNGIEPIDDVGYQLQASAMVVPTRLQAYVSGAQIFGTYGDPWELRGGASWYFTAQRGLRVNGEVIHVRRSPVGYTAYPMPVGANGTLLHFNLEMNF
jgi:hypothetical protein